MLDPLRKKEDTETMFQIAELAARFTAKYVNGLKLNGIPDELIAIMVTNLPIQIIGTLWADPKAYHNAPDQKTRLEEFDVSDLEPN